MREAFRFRSFSIPFTKRFLFACGVHEAFEFTKPSNSRSDVLVDKGKTEAEADSSSYSKPSGLSTYDLLQACEELSIIAVCKKLKCLLLREYLAIWNCLLLVLSIWNCLLLVFIGILALEAGVARRLATPGTMVCLVARAP